MFCHLRIAYLIRKGESRGIPRLKAYVDRRPLEFLCRRNGSTLVVNASNKTRLIGLHNRLSHHCFETSLLCLLKRKDLYYDELVPYTRTMQCSINAHLHSPPCCALHLVQCHFASITRGRIFAFLPNWQPKTHTEYHL